MGILAPESLTNPQATPNPRPAIHWTRFPARALPHTNWADHVAAHKAVMRLFPTTLTGPAGQRRAVNNILFRIDVINNEPVVLVQSVAAPELLPTDARTMVVSDRAWTFHDGDPVQFRAAVNPIRRNGRHKTTTVVPAADAPGWFTTKLADIVSDLTILNHTRDTHTHRDPTTKTTTPLVIDTYDCHATITNAARFETLRRTGLGRAKSYGSGLITAQHTH